MVVSVHADDMDADAIVNGVHGYMPENYVVPKEPEVRARLEWFKDQKLALMMHFGMYSQMGIYESWALSDADAQWSRKQLDWVADGETFKRQYWNLWRSFNPTRFQPQKWAKLAKDNGFRYLISADRTAGGACENVITPEQTVPPQPLAVPWESCITMGTGFSYRYDDEFKSPRELVHLLLDVVAKGGNLALNVAPGPDGRLPEPAIDRMEALGRWLKANGEGVYGTRPAAPYATGSWRFNGKDGKVYAFLLWDPGQRSDTGITIPAVNPEKVTSVTHLATGISLDFTATRNGLELRLPETLRLDPYAEGFVLAMEPR